MSKLKLIARRSKPTLTGDQALALLDALSDSRDNEEENDMLRDANPILYAAILQLRELADA